MSLAIGIGLDCVVSLRHIQEFKTTLLICVGNHLITSHHFKSHFHCARYRRAVRLHDIAMDAPSVRLTANKSREKQRQRQELSRLKTHPRSNLGSNTVGI